jgi:hypothetical protein
MLDLATTVVGEKKRESFSGEELRAYDEGSAKKIARERTKCPWRNAGQRPPDALQ